MLSSTTCTYGNGLTRNTMVGTEGSQPAKGSQSQKGERSPDCSLRLESMKSESLVVADPHVAVNTFPGLVHTARDSVGVESARSRLPNRKEGAYHGGFHDWGEVVTR